MPDIAEPVDFWAMLEPISRADDIHALRDATMFALGKAGFDAAYFLAPVVADPRIARVMTNCGFAQEWGQYYRAEGYLHDPLPQIAMTRKSAFVWPDDVPREDLTPGQLEYLDRLPGYGMERGIAVPCFGPYARCGFVGVGLPAGDHCFDGVNIMKVEVCARRSFQHYSSFTMPFGDEPAMLSQREIEVLQLIAGGKSNAVIAQLLEIAPNTVDVYVKRIFAKLGVSDRTNASVRGLALGLVVAGTYPETNRI